ncbi:MAG: AAA family ATPase [SAR202 cluster bacterium]|nr:AAA family ATPase [SAR202 cluster bacterium]
MSDLLKFLKNSLVFSLTQSQKEAAACIDQVLDSRSNCLILKGYAGTGKTTLLYGVSRYLAANKRNFKLMAPTGRAAKVIAEKTKFNAYTIHKSIYSMDNLKEYKETEENGSETFKYFFELHDNDDTTNTVYIVDESSMVSDQYSESEFFRFGSGLLLHDLLEYISFTTPKIARQIIFIGDSAQLPPINMSFSPALDKKYLKKLNLSVHEIEMTDVARQKKNSGILSNATSIRQQIADQRFNKIILGTDYDDLNPISHEEIVDRYLGSAEKQNGIDGPIIAYSNKSVQHYNEAVRSRIFPDKKNIQTDDKFLVVRNNYNYGVLNGEFGTIKKVYTSSEIITLKLRKKSGEINIELKFKDVCVEVADFNGIPIQFDCKIVENQLDSKEPQLTSDEQRAIYVLFKLNNKGLKAGTPEFKEAIKEDRYYNALQIKYGYAVTCHKAQGGEWNNCIIDFYTSQTQFREEYFRWCYTALTRCKENLYSLNTPQLSPTSGLDIMQNKTDAINDNQQHKISENAMKNIPENLDIKTIFQMALYEHVVLIINSNPTISNIQHFDWAERYLFTTEPETTTIDFHYNKSQKISSIRVIRPGTGCEDLLKQLKPIENQIFYFEAVSDQEGDIQVQTDKKHLEDFYDSILVKLKGSDVKVGKIEHNEYHEKYHFTRNNELAIFLFYYNKHGRFKKTIPDHKKSNSEDLIDFIKNIIL